MEAEDGRLKEKLLPVNEQSNVSLDALRKSMLTLDTIQREDEWMTLQGMTKRNLSEQIDDKVTKTTTQHFLINRAF